MNKYAVIAENLTKKFGDFTAVDTVMFKVKKGCIYGFLGANGAGKTTTIRMLCGLLEPTSGCGSVAGFSIKGEAEKIKKNLGYMSQKFALYDTLTVEENIEFYAGLYGMSRQETKNGIKEVLKKTELKDSGKTPVRDIPGGIKQRVALACAIMHSPEVIFLDEPTAGVDPLLRRRFWEIIEEMSENGVTVFVTTHYMDEVEHCHRIALMNGGRIIKEGTIGEIKKETFTAPIYEVGVSDPAAAYKKLTDRQDNMGDISIHGAMLHIIPEKTINDPEAGIKAVLKKENIDFGHFSTAEPSMEDVFVRLVRDK